MGAVAVIPFDLAAALELLARGCTRRAIAAHLEVSVQVLARRLKAAGVPKGRPGRRPASTPRPGDPEQLPIPACADLARRAASGDDQLLELRRLQASLGISREEVESVRAR